MCKAALAQYYRDLNASRTEANQAQGGTEGADGPHEDSDAGAAETAGSGNVSARATGAAGATGVTHAALRQQLATLQYQLQALQVAIAPGTHDPNTAASGGGPPKVAASPAAFSVSIQGRRAQGVLLKGAPTPNKTAGLQWTAHPKLDLALMAES